MDKNLYPSNWKEISLRIRNRENWKCKWCGAPNGEYIIRDNVDPAKWRIPSLEDESIALEYLASKKAIKVMLTVAHLDHDTAHNDDSNLAALCQRCHLRHDSKQHVRNAAKTRQRKQEKATGQMRLIE